MISVNFPKGGQINGSLPTQPTFLQEVRVSAGLSNEQTNSDIRNRKHAMTASPAPAAPFPTRRLGLPPEVQEFFGKLHPHLQDVRSSAIKQVMRFWSESICEMDRDKKIGPRLVSKCSRPPRVKAVGLRTQTESIPVCLHFALWCE